MEAVDPDVQAGAHADLEEAERHVQQPPDDNRDRQRPQPFEVGEVEAAHEVRHAPRHHLAEDGGGAVVGAEAVRERRGHRSETPDDHGHIEQTDAQPAEASEIEEEHAEERSVRRGLDLGVSRPALELIPRHGKEKPGAEKRRRHSHARPNQREQGNDDDRPAEERDWNRRIH